MHRLAVLALALAAAPRDLAAQTEPAAPAQAATQGPAAPRSAGNAAPLYEQLAKDVQRLTEAGENAVEIPFADADGEPSDWRFEGPEWTAAIARFEPVRTVLLQAARMPECAFAAEPDAALSPFDELALPLWQSAMLTAAHGWQQRQGHPDAALLDAGTLLRFARHASAQSAFGASLGNRIEMLGVALARGLVADAPTPELTARVAREVEAHAAARTGLRGIAAVIAAEVHRIAAATLRPAQAAPPGADPTGLDVDPALLRTRGGEVATRLDALVAAWLLPLRDGDDASTDAVRAAVAKVGEQVRTMKPNVLRKQLRALDGDAAVETLAQLLAMLLVPDLERIVGEETSVRDQLAACRARLAALQAPK